MDDFPKAYNPKEVEDRLYLFWEEGGFFSADPNSKKTPYTIVLPPPNVTGVLHMGHALVDTIQDILIRHKRMCGYEALWVPGTDHAGISTQTVVERHLIATEGKRRREYTRDDFLKHVWDWKEKNEERILFQLKQLGCSCDWEKHRFTMDTGSNRSVRTVFKKMFDEGLIYRGDYLVNWDPVTQTALADDEVEYEDRKTSLWHFAYPLADGSGKIHIATTRPETLLGDTAVAVSPKDDRYKEMVGKKILLPIMDREIPIIADIYVDPSFGTGAVKMTPAHDPNDYQIGINHNLEMINILTPDGKINENGGPYAGLTTLEAREKVVAKMKELGLLVKIEPYAHRVGVSYRSKAVIEPYLSKQWFVKMEPFKQKLIDAVKKNKVRLVPKNWENTYFHWIENLRDWCISRQLWWGHQIPIWYHKDNPEKKICFDGEGLPPEVAKEPEMWEQDPDVLDTWFSSALWPFSTLGWPENTDLLKKFYPNSTLITGHDILFFWVARMIMMGEYVMGEVPFDTSFLHGLIYGKSYWREKDGAIAYVSADEQAVFDLGEPIPKEVHSKWEKMSKSKGNVIDPLEIIDIYGADAMRMALTASCTHARQIDLDRRRFEEYKNFANKIWNGARFVFMNLTISVDDLKEGLLELTLEDQWILLRLNRAAAEIHGSIESYNFDKAATKAYSFFWDDFCSYYLELVKPVLFGKVGDDALRVNKQKLLLIVLSAALRLMHPMTPFITEELFQRIKERFCVNEVPQGLDPYTEDLFKSLVAPACIVAPYPTSLNKDHINNGGDGGVEKAFAEAKDFVQAIRNVRAEMGIPPKESSDLHIVGGMVGSLPETHLTIIQSLTRIGKVTTHKSPPKLPFSSKIALHGLTIIIPLPENLREKEKARIEKERAKLETQISSLKARLANKAFTDKAPKELVEKTKALLEEMNSRLSSL